MIVIWSRVRSDRDSSYRTWGCVRAIGGLGVAVNEKYRLRLRLNYQQAKSDRFLVGMGEDRVGRGGAFGIRGRGGFGICGGTAAFRSLESGIRRHQLKQTHFSYKQIYSDKTTVTLRVW